MFFFGLDIPLILFPFFFFFNFLIFFLNKFIKIILRNDLVMSIKDFMMKLTIVL